MKILVTGSTGLVGSALVDFLAEQGHEVRKLVRTEPTSAEDEIHWSPDTGSIDKAGLEGLDAVVHLAGENLASGKWTAEKKARIRNSRVEGTGLLCESLSELAQPPKALMCSSAIGYYGNRGDAVVNEGAFSGSGFLADVCHEWEAATGAATEAGIRVVNLRIGVVLSPDGGALAKMLPPFRMGSGGKLGNGKQYISWIALDDVVEVIHHVLTQDGLHGPVNAVTPHAVTNSEFTKTLGRVLNRPTLFGMPAFMVRSIFGEMADEMLLASTRVEPSRLVETAYTYHYPELEDALRHLLGK
jgi:uncharacterized protein (TIGR01777 family)